MPKKHLYLSEESIEIAMKYQDENNLTFSKAIDEIIKKFDSNSDITIKSMYQFMADKIADELKNEFKNITSNISNEVTSNLKPQLNALKYSSNSTNKDTQIALEILNGICYKEDYGNIPALDKIPSQAYTVSKERVETKIAKEHYRKSGTLD